MLIRVIYFGAYLAGVLIPLLVGGGARILGDPRGQAAIGLGIAWALVEASIHPSQFARKLSDLAWVAAALLGATGAFTVVVLQYVHRPELIERADWIAAMGLTLAVVGLVIRFAAMRTLGEFFSHALRIAAGHRIIEAGLYRRLRHPSYLGFAMVCFGVPLLFGSVQVFLFILIPILAAVAVRILVEEQILLDHFGDEYRAYQARTNRLVPFVW